MLSSLKEFVRGNKEDVINVVQLMLNACAEGFKHQRKNQFGFVDYDAVSPELLSNLNMNQLNKAPINTIAAERTVGASN